MTQATLIDTEESLAPIPAFIQEHGISVDEVEITVQPKGSDRKIPKMVWVASCQEMNLFGESRNEAVLKVAQSIPLKGWEDINWDA